MLSSILYAILVVIIILISLKLYVKLTTGWCKSQVCLVGKTVIITGGNTGIGFETAKDLAKRGAKVILACRNEEKVKLAEEQLKKETDNLNISYKILDLCSFKSVQKFAEEINNSEQRLDVLINNAGLCADPENTVSKDGLQPVMQTNYFGPFLLTKLLLDLLKKSSPSRIVNVSSIAGAFSPLYINKLNDTQWFLRRTFAYGRSKLCNLLFTIELDKRIKEAGITTYSLHPGFIDTEITRNLPKFFKVSGDFVLKWFFKNSVEGAQTSIYCAVAKGIEKHSGKHFHDCHVVSKYLTARGQDLPTKLWEKTEEIIKLHEPLM